ncbi:M23 family metallopeptidase [Sphingomonas sp. MMS24-JH45]
MAIPQGRRAHHLHLRDADAPLLGFLRMHKGMDIGAPYGAPILAAVDGVVAFAATRAATGDFIKSIPAGSSAATAT